MDCGARGWCSSCKRRRGLGEQLILELDGRGARRREGGEGGGLRGCCMRAVAKSGADDAGDVLADVGVGDGAGEMVGGGAVASQKGIEEVSRTSETEGADGVHADVGVEGDRVGGR